MENKLIADPCTVATLIKMVDKFNKTGCLVDQLKSGRPSLMDDRKDAVESTNEDIKLTNSWGVSSIRHMSNKTGISPSSVHCILTKKLLMKNSP